MPSVLITAYKPYAEWPENASWLAIQELVKDLPKEPEVTTRLYPVDFAETKRRLAEEMEANYDVALHLGQSPDSGLIRLESVGINVAVRPTKDFDTAMPLVEEGPAAYQSTLPLADWARKLRAGGVPAQVSYHAGTYLCNAALYLSHYLAETRSLKTRSTFLHVPLATSQVIGHRRDLASMPPAEVARALRLILEEIR